MLTGLSVLTLPFFLGFGFDLYSVVERFTDKLGNTANEPPLILYRIFCNAHDGKIKNKLNKLKNIDVSMTGKKISL